MFSEDFKAAVLVICIGVWLNVRAAFEWLYGLPGRLWDKLVG